MNVWKWEMDMCCSMQIESLRKQLQECKNKGITTEIALSPEYPAAPRNESLFDCVMLYAKSLKDCKLEVSGTVFYWSPGRGNWQKSSVIRIFDNLDECINWLSNEDKASEECTEFLYEKCY